MNISIYSQDSKDFVFLSRTLAMYQCQQLRFSNSPAAISPAAQLLILDLDNGPAEVAEILHILSTSSLPVLLLASDLPSTPALLKSLSTRPAAVQLEFKPLRRHAIAARIELLLQQAYPEHAQQQRQRIGDYVFDAARLSVSWGNSQVALTQKEFALASLLFNNLDRPLSRVTLQESVWGEEEDEDALPTRTVDTHISRVRNKLQLKPENGFRLSTVYGFGYQLEQLNRVKV